jgi:hypothetical protein
MRMKIELLDVTCHDHMDGCEGDAFYVLSAFHVGTEIVQVGLTTPMSVRENETVRFISNESVLFDADVTDKQSIAGGMIAFHADFSSDWHQRTAWLASIQAQVLKMVQKQTLPPAHMRISSTATLTTINTLSAASVLAAAANGWYLVAPRVDEQNELGQVTVEGIEPHGSTLQEMLWAFKWVRPTWSKWGYVLRYQIARG